MVFCIKAGRVVKAETLLAISEDLFSSQAVNCRDHHAVAKPHFMQVWTEPREQDPFRPGIMP